MVANLDIAAKSSPCGLDTKLSASSSSARYIIHNNILTLAELESLACLWTTRLLALHCTWVAGYEACCTEGSLVVGVDLHKCTGNCKAKCLCLPLVATTTKIHINIIFLSYLKEVKRLLNDELKD